MYLGTKQTESNQLNLVLQLLAEAAQFLKNKHINQWAHWLHPPQDKVQWVEEGIENGEFYFVYDEANNLIAMYRLMYEDELYWGKQNQKAVYVHSLVVRRNFSGKGVGSNILNAVAQKAKNENINLFRLDCNAANKDLCNYYEKLGFVKVGEKQMPHSLNNLYEKNL